MYKIKDEVSSPDVIAKSTYLPNYICIKQFRLWRTCLWCFTKRKLRFINIDYTGTTNCKYCIEMHNSLSKQNRISVSKLDINKQWIYNELFFVIYGMFVI